MPTSTPDIWTKLQLNEDPDATHPVLPQDQATGARMQCQNCHNTHAVTSNKPLVDPHDPGPSGVWTGDGTQRQFCFRCHDGAALPTSAETTPWAEAVLARPATATASAATTVADIQLAYATNIHGSGSLADTATAQSLLRPDMGYVTGTTLDCDACHDPHGSSNGYDLRPSVSSAAGTGTADGLLVYKIPSGGYDLRFFCSSCHLFDPATHDTLAGTSTTAFPTDCTQCHKHMDGAGTGGGTGL